MLLVDEVDRLSAVAAGGVDRRERLDEAGDIGEGHMAQVDKGADRFQLNPGPQGIAEGAVRIGKAVEEIGVVAIPSRRHDLPVAGQNVQLDH